MRRTIGARFRMLVIGLLIVQGCSDSSHPDVAPATQPAGARTLVAKPPKESWVGIYSSPKEIGGFAGTVLDIERDSRGGFSYRMRSYSDVIDANEIREDGKFGELLIDGDRLYVPEASGYMHEGKPSLFASLTRYTRMTIRGRIVLLRDDALKAYREQNRLYDYGILIKVSDRADRLTDLGQVKHESIKVLYDDPGKPWHDPFVSGPNPR